MRAVSLTSLAILALIVVSCDSTPAEPPGVEADATAPLFKANQVWNDGSFYTDFVAYAECLGEDVRLYGEVPYRWHQVWNSSGGYNYVFVLEAATPQTLFLMTGLSSGIVWEGRGSVDPATYHAGPGEVIHAVTRETYISRDGPTVQISGGSHVTINANGEVTVSREPPFETVCNGQG